jgi:kynurenine formamidase
LRNAPFACVMIASQSMGRKAMCVPGCQEHVFQRLSRRNFFKRAGLAAAGAAATVSIPSAAVAMPGFSKVIDLTHTFDESFPTFNGAPGIKINKLFDFEKNGYNLNQWVIEEHSGTHMDAPIHFAKEGMGPAEIAVESLVVPLAVIDISAKAATDPDAQVTPDDIRAWESANGNLPAKCCVAMHSGWAKHLGTDKFRNVGADKAMHFPGFSLDAAKFLMAERDVSGIAVDTLSLDHGASKDFATHYAWLPSGRWGIENVANLDQVPATGATLVLGGPKIKGVTGGLSRVFALVA